MAKRNTRQLIADTFVELVKESSLSRVRVADVIERLDINRNTYYYHFTGKTETALWVFRRALADELQKSFPKDQLVSNTFSTRFDSKMPYYVHVEIGARTLDCSGFFRALLVCVQRDDAFFRKLFTMQELDFIDAVSRLYYPALLEDVRFILGGRYMPPETQHMVATLSARHLVSTVEFFLQNKSLQTSLLDERANPFGNMLQEALFNAIQAHPINRYSPKRP